MFLQIHTMSITYICTTISQASSHGTNDQQLCSQSNALCNPFSIFIYQMLGIIVPAPTWIPINQLLDKKNSESIGSQMGPIHKAAQILATEAHKMTKLRVWSFEF